MRFNELKNIYSFHLSSIIPAGGILQVFDLALKSKVASHTSNDAVVFWKWISNTTVAYVTEKSVYHWTVLGGRVNLLFIITHHRYTKYFDIVCYTISLVIDNYFFVTDEKHVPELIFDRDAQLAEMQIVNYIVTEHIAASHNWSCLVGLTAKCAAFYLLKTNNHNV